MLKCHSSVLQALSLDYFSVLEGFGAAIMMPPALSRVHQGADAAFVPTKLHQISIPRTSRT